MNSGQQPEQETPSTLTDASVEQYLRDNPNFFEHHLNLLTTLKVSHPNLDTAVSLIERQVSVLRQQNSSSESKLMELVQIARENEQLSRQLHLLASELLKVRSLSDVIAVSQDKLRELFETDFVALRLLSDFSDDEHLAVNPDTFRDLFQNAVQVDNPICGRVNKMQADYLFENNSLEVGSSAVILLNAVDPIGVLALGSRDKQRFTPKMGNLFLTLLGDLVSSALVAHIR